MIMTTKMKTEAAAMISCYDNKKKYDMYCKSYYQTSRFSPM